MDRQMTIGLMVEISAFRNLNGNAEEHLALADKIIDKVQAEVERVAEEGGWRCELEEKMKAGL